jgi:putative ABC transport system permease protein
MDTISDRLTAVYPADYDNMCAVLVPVAGEIVGAHQQLFYTLLGAVGLVLLVGCVNVANLMLARSAERAQEFAVRAALGARRGRLVRQMLTESVLLAGLGGLLGLVVARVSVPMALALLPPENAVPRISEVTIDWVVFAFTLGVSVVVGVLFGLAPALRVSQSRLQNNLKEMGRGTSLSRRGRIFGSLLVTAEVALSLFLLIAAGLLLRSFMLLQSIDSGFDTARVLVMELTVPLHRYGVYEVGGANPPRARLYRDLAREARNVPGVQTAALTALLPLKHGPNPWGISIEGRGAPADEDRGGAARSLRTGLYHHGSISIERVTPEYFATMGVSLVRGRLLDERDTAGAPLVTLVNETFVKKFFPSEDPVGRRITADMTSYFPKLTIVGVVADNKMHGLDREPYPLLFWSIEQLPSINASLVVRTAGAPDSVAKAVRGTIARFDPDLAVKNVMTMDAVVDDSMWRQRFATFLLGVFAGLALLLATAGVYAVISYSVSQRTQEVGLRIAFGATPRKILGLVVGYGLRLTVAGVLAGIALSLMFRSLVASQLFGISATDPLTIVAVSSALMLVALAACTVPAIRVLRIDPVEALRQT